MQMNQFSRSDYCQEMLQEPDLEIPTEPIYFLTQTTLWIHKSTHIFFRPQKPLENWLNRLNISIRSRHNPHSRGLSNRFPFFFFFYSLIRFNYRLLVESIPIELTAQPSVEYVPEMKRMDLLPRAKGRTSLCPNH